MGEVGLLLVQLLASSRCLLVSGSNDLQLGNKCTQTCTIGHTLVHGLSQQVRGPQQPALVAGWASARLGSANGPSQTLITHNTLQFILQSQTEVQETYPAGTSMEWLELPQV